MATKTVRRSLAMTPEMRDLLRQLVRRRGPDATEAELIREAIRRFLDEQDDLLGSRRHFQKTFQARIDRLEDALAFQLNALTYLLTFALVQMLPRFSGERTSAPLLLQQAIIAARREGDRLLAQMEAARDLPDPP